jgi:hypothetical protein
MARLVGNIPPSLLYLSLCRSYAGVSVPSSGENLLIDYALLVWRVLNAFQTASGTLSEQRDTSSSFDLLFTPLSEPEGTRAGGRTEEDHLQIELVDLRDHRQ